MPTRTYAVSGSKGQQTFTISSPKPLPQSVDMEYLVRALESPKHEPSMASWEVPRLTEPTTWPRLKIKLQRYTVTLPAGTSPQTAFKVLDRHSRSNSKHKTCRYCKKTSESTDIRKYSDKLRLQRALLKHR